MKVLLILAFFITTAVAAELDININPKKPVFNETFTVEFVIKTDKQNVEPVISFDPLGAEVVSKSDVSTSTQYSYINGRSTIERKMAVTYELIARQPGMAYLRSILVEVGDEKLRHQTLNITILKNPQPSKKIFVRAEVDKKEVYAGESIIARYYLYSRADVPVSSMEIKKFPKLNTFLKRFHQEQISPQRVKYDGKIYIRRIMYTAQLYAQTPGEYEIDPITMRVAYTKNSNSFSGFGLGFQIGKPMYKTLISPSVEINVLPLPAQGMPQSFTGLVGKHSFELKINKNKFIANEPIELDLTIQGPGALELYEAPHLLDDKNLEEFEKSSDLIVNKDFSGTKKIDYTYLGRGNVGLKNQKVKFSYFDPEEKKYVEKTLNIGDVTVASIGGQKKVSYSDGVNKNPSVQNSSVEVLDQSKSFIFKPLTKTWNTFLYNKKEIFIFFVGLCVLLVIMFAKKLYRSRTPKEYSIFDEIDKFGINYSRLYRLITERYPSLTMSEAIKKLGLSQEGERYFLDLIKMLNASYANSETKTKNIKIQKKYFKELQKKIENAY
ncbi:MAG: hypothetical protein CME66_12470 [Halobacteriovoraceae bacterium]|jgi:hypothetical protein|nr:hypothetical protein [Halobacteriovoraceae bacterium]